MNSEILDTNEENFTMEYTPPSPFSSLFSYEIIRRTNLCINI